MNLLKRVSFLGQAVNHLGGIRKELARIADHLGAAVAPDLEHRSSFRSYYDDKGSSNDADVSYLDDEDRVAMEVEAELERIRGGPAIPGFYEGEDDRVGSVVGPTVTAGEPAERETEEEP